MASEEYQDLFLHVNLRASTPVSEASDVSETDFEDDSEVEKLSPQFSLDSTRRRSETTISSIDNVHTPDSNGNKFYNSSFNISAVRSVEGPQGPHLFRGSLRSSMAECNNGSHSNVNAPQIKSRSSNHSTTIMDEFSSQSKKHPLEFPDATEDHVNFADILWWTPQKVSRWLRDAGFESPIAEKFEANDISGVILTTLKFEDLKELGILSFGQRTKIWDEINSLRENASEVTRTDRILAPSDIGSKEQLERPLESEISSNIGKGSWSQNNLKRPHRKYKDETSRPFEPVSIIGIEQLLPKPHWCAKGENCSKWKKQQRLLENMKREYSIDFNQGWSSVPSDLESKETSGSIVAPYPAYDSKRFASPSSNLIDLASSSLRRTQLKEESLRGIESVDPQESMKQFIRHQNIDKHELEHEHKPTVAAQTSLNQPTDIREAQYSFASTSQVQMTNQPAPLRHQMERAAAASSVLANSNISRVDVPVTATFAEPIARETSLSAPPNVSNLHVPTCASIHYPSSQNSSDTNELVPHMKREINHAYNHSPLAVDEATHTGWMMKRRTKMLRHEWQQHHFTLKGTQLAMRKDDRSLDTLKYIDVDDYAIACSSFASSSKLAFKALLISRDKHKTQVESKDAAAFAFQLIPTVVPDKETQARQRTGAAALTALVTGKPTTSRNFGMKNKTHHFAVRSRDERIDWMRELMLAKALSQKNRGYEVKVNGSLL
ncbi:hypothetical protein K3495_g2227 [Podosphaera aphanis]|nr:hypothetical protein K3495_g2227 [Podosphaera aphanis]